MQNEKSKRDQSRLIRNLIQMGTVEQVDTEQGGGGRVRVRLGGDMVTNWLPWICQRAGAVRIWSAPSVGEQCVVLSPGGNLTAGIVMAGIFSSKMPAPDDAGRANDVIIDVPSGGRLLLRCGGSTIEMTAERIKQAAQRIDLNE